MIPIPFILRYNRTNEKQEVCMISNLYPVSFPRPLEGKMLFDLLSRAAAQTFGDEETRLSLITTEQRNDAGEFEESHLSIIFDQHLFADDPRWKTICIRVGGPPIQSGVNYPSIKLFVFRMHGMWGLWKPLNLRAKNDYFLPLVRRGLDEFKKRIGALASKNG